MANVTTNASAPSVTGGFRAKVADFFVGIGNGFQAYAQSRSRIDRIQALQRKSDAELAKMGLRREDIAAHVFRDLFFI